MKTSISLSCVPEGLRDNKTALLEVMAWCHQETSHDPDQCFLIYAEAFDITIILRSMATETREVLFKRNNLPLHRMTLTKSCWSILLWKTTCLERPHNLSSVRTRQNFQARALGDFHRRVSSAAWAWGHKFSSEAMQVYMGENRFTLWSYHIGTVFKSIQLSFDIYRVSNHHLVHDIHQMVGGLHNL